MKNPLPPAVRSRARQGFTLLELVVVVAVLVILAGILLPKFDLFKLKANKGVAASNMTDVSRIIQTYFAQNAVYPDNWDSLMVDDENLWDTANASGDGVQLEPQTVGGPPTAASPHKLIAMASADGLSDGEARSLARIGITAVVDVDDASTSAPNDRFGPALGVPVTTTPLSVHTRAIAEGIHLATLNTAGDGDARAIRDHIYPNGAPLPADKRLVVFGFGSHNTAIGNLVQEVPFYPNTDVTKYYSRFLAIFEVSSGGSRAQLMAVVGADGDMIKEEIADYYEK